MIGLEVVDFHIGLSQEWSAAKIDATGYHIVLDKRFFTRFGEKFYCNSSNILFHHPGIRGFVKYPLTFF